MTATTFARWKWLVVPVLSLIVAGASLLLAPNKVCRRLPGGDEVEGECLGVAARASPVTRCRVLTALLAEIRSTNNDVVIAGGLEGIVASGACSDIALLWTRLPAETPSHVYPLVAYAWTTCQRRSRYSLPEARRSSTEVVPALLQADARNARCG